MADLRIQRTHSLGLKAARKLALTWAEQVEQEFGMECSYEEGEREDTVHFTRAGVNGTLYVSAVQFDLNAKLGFLLGAFKGRIEAEIVARLDALLAQKAPAKKVAAKKTAAKKAAGRSS